MTLPQNDTWNNIDHHVEFVFRNDVWFTDLFIDALLTIVSLYLLTSLIRHRVVRVRLRARRQRKLSKESHLSSSAKLICILIAFISSLYQLLSLGHLYLEKSVYRTNVTSEYEKRLTEGFCHAMPKARVSVLIVGTALTYLFLWTRQRVFYVNPSLKALNSKLVKVTSYLVLIFWILYFVPVVLVYLILVQYENLSLEGCVLTKNSRILFRNVIVSWLCVSVAMQIALLALFINPILNRMTWKNHVRRKSKSVARLLKRVKRAVTLTALCLLSDTVCGVSVILLFQANSNTYTFVYNINVVVNLFAVIGCFDYWLAIFRPCTSSPQSDSSKRYSETSRKFSTSFTPRYSPAAASFTVIKTKPAASPHTVRKISCDNTLLPSDVRAVSSTETFENV